MAQAKLAPVKLPTKFPEMPWKKNKPADGHAPVPQSKPPNPIP